MKNKELGPNLFVWFSKSFHWFFPFFQIFLPSSLPPPLRLSSFSINHKFFLVLTSPSLSLLPTLSFTFSPSFIFPFLVFSFLLFPLIVFSLLLFPFIVFSFLYFSFSRFLLSSFSFSRFLLCMVWMYTRWSSYECSTN